MNFILIIAPVGSINNETVFVICSGCCFYHKSGTLKKGPMTIYKKQLTEGPRPFFLVPTASKRLLRRLSFLKRADG